MITILYKISSWFTNWFNFGSPNEVIPQSSLKRKYRYYCPSFKRLQKAAKAHQYVVMSRKKIRYIYNTNHQEIDIKPKGLWFGIQDHWIRWIKYEMPQWKEPNLTSLEIDENKLLIIDTVEKIQEFDQTYGRYLEDFPNFRVINWKEVAKQYDGILFPVYFPDQRRIYIWYNAIDIPSGCIWNKQAVKNFQSISVL
jgi:hypothetical protein